MINSAIPSLADQVRALAAAAAELMRTACAVQHATPAAIRGAVNRRRILELLDREGPHSLARICAALNGRSDVDALSKSGAYHLADSMRQRGWLSYEIQERAGLPVGHRHPGIYAITPLGLAALNTMRQSPNQHGALT